MLNYKSIPLNQAIDIIIKYEGLSLVPYINIYGKVAIGYGTTGKHIGLASISDNEAKSLLIQDVLDTAYKVEHLINANNYILNNNQFNAFVSFFNSNYFENEMTNKFKHRESLKNIIDSLLYYFTINNKNNDLLLKRRQEEHKLTNS